MDQNSRSIKFGVDLIRDESKVPSSEQQGQFLAHVAATPSPMCLVHTSARHAQPLAQQLKWLLILQMAQNRPAIRNRWKMITRKDWRRGNLPKMCYEHIGSGGLYRGSISSLFTEAFFNYVYVPCILHQYVSATAWNWITAHHWCIPSVKA